MPDWHIAAAVAGEQLPVPLAHPQRPLVPQMPVEHSPAPLHAEPFGPEQVLVAGLQSWLAQTFQGAPPSCAFTLAQVPTKSGTICPFARESAHCCVPGSQY